MPVHRGDRVPSSPTVSVCVLVLDDVDQLEACLESVARSTQPDVEMVVVANGTPEAAVAALATRSDIVFARRDVNAGFGGGANLAASLATAPYLVFLNDDSILDRGCLSELVGAADSDPRIGAVSSRILSIDGSLQEAGAVLWRDGSAALVGRGARRGSEPHLVRREVDFGSANGMLVRRAAWEEVGGFDEQYFPAYYEDADLCMALRERGWSVVFEPAAELTHLESRSSSPRFKEFLIERHRGVFARKWSARLAAFEEAPIDRRDAAIARSIGRAQQRGSERTSPTAGRPGATQRPSVRSDRFYLAAALEVRAAFVASLEAQLDVAEADLARNIRWKRKGRALVTRIVDALPEGVAHRLRTTFRG